jgi:hypothetical protein
MKEIEWCLLLRGCQCGFMQVSFMSLVGHVQTVLEACKERFLVHTRLSFFPGMLSCGEQRLVSWTAGLMGSCTWRLNAEHCIAVDASGFESVESLGSTLATLSSAPMHRDNNQLTHRFGTIFLLRMLQSICTDAVVRRFAPNAMIENRDNGHTSIALNSQRQSDASP